MKLTRYKHILNVVLLAISCVVYGQKQISTEVTMIKGFYDSPQKSDTVYLTIWKDYVSYEKRIFTHSKTISTVIENNEFSFRIDSLFTPIYINLSRGKRSGQFIPFIDQQICSPGDNVNIFISSNNNSVNVDNANNEDITHNYLEEYKFSGFGAEKYECFWELKKIENQSVIDKNKIDNMSLKDIFEKTYENHLKWINQRITILNKYENRISKEILMQIKADVIGKYGNNFFRLSKLQYKYGRKELSEQDKTIFLLTYKRILKDFDSLYKIPIETQSKSAFYPEMLISKMLLDNHINDYLDNYLRLKSQLSGILRQRVVTNFLLNFSHSNNTDSLINDALMFVILPPYKNALIQLKSNLRNGDIVNDFSLLNENDKNIKLSDFKGKVLFIDFWFSGCGACSYYYKNIVSKAEMVFRNNPKIVFISISIDTDKKTWLKSVNSGIYTSNHAVNLYTSFQGSSHPVLQKFNVTKYPHPILIDKAGRIITNDKAKLRGNGLSELINTLNKAL